MKNHGFEEPAVRKGDPNSREWILAEEFCYDIEWAFGSKCTLVIESGFTFDLASVPRIFWMFLSHTDLSIAAPLVHDYLYKHRGKPPGGCRLSRHQSDRVFYNMMSERGVIGWRKKIAYWTVKKFGTWGEDYE